METRKHIGCGEVPRRTFIQRAAGFALAIGCVLAGRPSKALGLIRRDCSDPECQEMEDQCEEDGANWLGECWEMPPGPDQDLCEQQANEFIANCANQAACCCCHRVSELCESCL